MRLIINADDFGMARSVNDAVFELCKTDSISSTSVMSNMPYASEAIRLIEFPKISIGLHINLTQGLPVSNSSEVNSLVDEQGFFFPKNILLSRISQKKVEFEHIKNEVWAQYFKLKELVGPRLSHFDSHQGSTRIPQVYEALVKLINQEQFKTAIRVHSKYYLNNSNREIVKPDLLSISEFGLRRVIFEYYFRLKRNNWRKNFKTPDGMLFNKDNSAISILSDLSKLTSRINNSGIFEISCHPAVNAIGLNDTQMLEIRIKEYELLKSKALNQAKKFFDLTNYYSL